MGLQPSPGGRSPKALGEAIMSDMSLREDLSQFITGLQLLKSSLELMLQISPSLYFILSLGTS